MECYPQIVLSTSTRNALTSTSSENTLEITESENDSSLILIRNETVSDSENDVNVNNIDRIVQRSQKFELFVVQPIKNGTKTSSEVWNYMKRLYERQSETGKIVPVAKMKGRIVCGPCSKRSIIKR